MAVISRERQQYAAPQLLDQPLSLSWLTFDVLAYVILVLASIVTHLWGLGNMAMHHDESIHAWMSWKFYTGAGGFTCAGGRPSPVYCYDPVYHGPALYTLTLISYFLFGDREATARFPEALCGILLVASTWMLRPYIGRRGALFAGVLVAFAPSLLYFTRFARHDGLMVLWEFWMVAGFFSYLFSGRARYLYLVAASIALAIATHELYYILFFLFGWFVLVRLLAENLPFRTTTIVLGAVSLVSLVLVVLNPQLTPNLAAGGIALLFLTVAFTSLLITRVWDRTPLLSRRLRTLWYDERGTLWIALGILLSIYVVLYSTFFADPRGILDGAYRGIEYWLGSQHEYARGDQPWYYYLMLLPIYEPLALFGGLLSAIYVFLGDTRGKERWLILAALLLVAVLVPLSGVLGTSGFIVAAGVVGLIAFLVSRWRDDLRVRPLPVQRVDTQTEPAYDELADDAELDAPLRANYAAIDLHELALETADETPIAEVPVPLTAQALVMQIVPLFLAFWFIGALVAFSWAGEKMPWLLVHIALPGNLLVAWTLGKLVSALNWRELPNRRAALIPFALVLALVALGVALWRLGAPADGLEGQTNLVQGIVPLVIGGVLIYGLLTIGQSIGTRATLAVCALTLAGLTGAYMIRASWLVVYQHPDTPIEPLIYTQSTPDVPLIAAEVRELAINQTRNKRSASDPVGGLSMPVIMDSGDASGEGSLAWPFQWYFRDFQRIENRNADFFAKATANSFQVAVDSKNPDGAKELAPVVIVYSPHVVAATRQALEQNYVERYDSKLNWWFPEGSKCDPAAPGYKKFYYSQATFAKAKLDKDCKNSALDQTKFGSVLAPILWPLQRENWPLLRRYMLYREMPETLPLNGREMQVWVRNDLTAGGASAGSTTAASSQLKLIAQQSYGTQGNADGQLDQPRGVAVGPQGNVYVVDTGNHRVEMFGPDGAFMKSIGGLGAGNGQFNEPRGIAVDAQGNLYVADTWNARVVKLAADGTFIAAWGEGKDIGSGRKATMTDGTEAGNTAAPLGFFGPRGIAVDTQGNVYVADTGNKRIVVTDADGKYLYQWGHFGAEPGAFSEPIGVAVDGQGNVYVADTWNGRMQVFSPGANNQVTRTPSQTWAVAGWQANTYDDPFVAVSKDGKVYGTVPNSNQAFYANQRGDVLVRWGGKGTDTAALTLPSGAAVGADGSVYIVDRGNGRVLKFQLPNVAAPTVGQ